MCMGVGLGVGGARPVEQRPQAGSRLLLCRHSWARLCPAPAKREGGEDMGRWRWGERKMGEDGRPQR